VIDCSQRGNAEKISIFEGLWSVVLGTY